MTTPLREDPERSCHVLVQFLRDRDSIQRDLILKDFCSKLREVRPKAKMFYALQVLMDHAPDYLAKHFEGMFPMQKLSPKPRADFAVITTKPLELLGAKLALGLGLEQKEDREFSGFRFWELDIPHSDGFVQNVVLTMTGAAGPESCANTCRVVAEQYEVGVFLLVGMAAGVRGKVRLGDVVAGVVAIDIETGRLEESGFVKGPDVFRIDPVLRRHINFFETLKGKWFEGLEEALGELKKTTELPKGVVSGEGSRIPDFSSGVVLSGKKKRADGSLPKLRADYHEQVKLLEMEASGLAQQAEELGRCWLVFKGVSDFGDKKSKDHAETGEVDRKIWQPVASLAATIAALNFIRCSYRSPAH